MLNSERCRDKAARVKLVIMDVDGVLTSGQIILDDNGVEYKAFHVRDGHGIKMAQRAGLTIAIITGRQSKVVEVRAAELGIAEVYQRSHDKLATYETLIAKLGLADEETAFIGDDIVDIPVMKRVGLSVAVADAEPYVKEISDLVTDRPGGKGAVREFLDFLLISNGTWEDATKKYFG